MTQYKIHIDKPLPDDSRINRHKDFEGLYGRYKTVIRRPRWYDIRKNPRMFAGMIAAAVLLFLVFEAVRDKQLMQENDSLIRAPFSPIDIPYQTFSLSGEEAVSLDAEGGTKLHIPADAFADAEGNPVSGQMELKYREFHNGTDLFIAGVPLLYDSAGSTHALNTAAMMEVRAFQGDMPLSLRKDKKISVEFVSEHTESGLNRYFLDTAKQSWVIRGPSSIQPIPVTGIPDAPRIAILSDAEVQAQIGKLPALPPAPLKPRKVSEAKKPFGIKADLTDFPEMQAYGDILWEHNDNTDATDPWKQKAFDRPWHDVRVKRLPGGDRYEILFTRDDESFRAVASPVFRGKAYEDAMKVYENAFAAYDAARKKRAASESEILRKRTDALAQQRTSQGAPAEAVSQGVVRMLEADALGYWSFGKVAETPFAGDAVSLTLDGKSLTHEKPFFRPYVFLMDMESGDLRQLPADKQGKVNLEFDPEKDYQLMTWTWDKKPAVMRPEAFREWLHSGKTMPKELPVTVETAAFGSLAELRAFLEPGRPS
jgi:hypothetical protein